VTAALSPVATATARLAFAANTLPEVRVFTSVVAPISPTAVVIGPPRMNTRGYGRLLTVQWNVYLVVAVNQYAVDTLNALAQTLIDAIERLTPAVVMSSGPSTYPNPTGGVLPAYVLVTQQEVTE
jgi:hypothetical protein